MKWICNHYPDPRKPRREGEERMSEDERLRLVEWLEDKSFGEPQGVPGGLSAAECKAAGCVGIYVRDDDDTCVAQPPSAV